MSGTPRLASPPHALGVKVSISRSDKTGDPQIDRTTETLMQSLARSHVLVGDGSGAAYGILVHGTFGSDVKNQNLPGIGRDGVEQSFNLGDVARYGLDGSIRTDVVMRHPNSPSSRPSRFGTSRPVTQGLAAPGFRKFEINCALAPKSRS